MVTSYLEINEMSDEGSVLMCEGTIKSKMASRSHNYFQHTRNIG